MEGVLSWQRLRAVFDTVYLPRRDGCDGQHSYLPEHTLSTEQLLSHMIVHQWGYVYTLLQRSEKVAKAHILGGMKCYSY
jgi:hypothetical protein